MPQHPAPGRPAGHEPPVVADAVVADAALGDEPLAEPTDAELYGMWPDPGSDPPDGLADWAAGMSAAELDAFFAVDEPPPGPEPEYVGHDGPLDALRPGASLAGLSQDVFESGLGRLSDDDLIGLLGAARRLASWQAAIELYAVTELDARRGRQAGHPASSRAGEHVSSELAAALALTARSADSLLGLSRNLARLPMVLTALLAGIIDRSRAEIFAAELSALDDVTAAAVAAAFRNLAGGMTTGQLRAALRTMVLAIDPDAARRRAERGRADARVEFWQEGSGNAALAGRELPQAEAIAADRRIAAIARALKEAGAPGGMDKLRAAVFAALLTGRDPESLLAPAGSDPAAAGGRSGCGSADNAGAGADGAANGGAATGSADSAATGGASADGAGSGSGSRAAGQSAAGAPAPGSLAALAGSVNLVMPASAWLGQSDAPGEIPGIGPVDADTCRALAARMTGMGTRWHVTLTDRNGRAMAHARAPSGPRGDPARWLASLSFAWLERGSCAHPRRVDGYRPPARLRELIRVRQRTCAFPGCRRPAAACDTDHTTAFENGGLTCECNLAPLCRRHHRAKQAPGWRLEQPEPGRLVWTAPHGRRYTVLPGSYPA